MLFGGSDSYSTGNMDTSSDVNKAAISKDSSSPVQVFSPDDGSSAFTVRR